MKLLKGVPKIIHSGISCSETDISTLDGLPKVAPDYITCADCYAIQSAIYNKTIFITKTKNIWY